MLTLLLVSALAAPFEGVLHVEATIEQVGTVPSTISVRPGDSRVDTQTQDLDVSILRRHGKPTVRLSHGDKTWVEALPVPARTDDPAAAPPPTKPAELLVPLELVVKKLGPETVNGVATEHVQVRETPSNGLTELWLAKDIHVDEGLTLVVPDKAAQLSGVLAGKGITGWPMKVVTSEAGHTVTVQTTQVDRRRLPADTFEVPKNYTKNSDR